MSFKEIAGHDHAVSFLRKSVASGRAGASLIFHGPAGVGRRTTALALAQALNCLEEPGEGCGRCSVCARIAHVEISTVQHGDNKGDACAYTRHPDVHLVVPGKDEIRISEARSVRALAQRRPFEGRRSVFIFDPAERMTTEAANAILKTLEEPPPSACLVLVASDPAALLPTIRSRCVLVPFHPLPAAAVADHLQAKAGLPAKDARMVARLTGGRLGRALSFDLGAYRERRDAILEVLGRLARPTPRAHVLDDAESLGSREDSAAVSAAIEILEALLRDVMVLQAGASPELLVNADCAGALRKIASCLQAPAGPSLRRVAAARRDLARNVNRRLLVEALLLDLASPGAPAAT